MDIIEKIRESNRIERIYRDPTAEEIAEFERFMSLPKIEIAELERFVSVYAPGNELRDREHRDVRIGRRILFGSPQVRTDLSALLDSVNASRANPWDAHMRYEMIHPFTDGNGRSGRMLWYWQMETRLRRRTDLGFLHAFYYQSLSDYEARTT